MTKPLPARVLVADPPWPSKPVSTRWAGNAASERHYKLMSMKDILEYSLPPTDENTVLFLWRLSSMQQQAIDVCKAWGFRPYGEMVWRKLTTRGNPHFGMGLLLRGSHETALVGVRRLPKPVTHTRDVFEAPTGQHSGKPEVFYEIVEKLLPGPYTELFARRQRPGWRCYGDELEA